MKKKILLSLLFSCCTLWSFADSGVKQVVTIEGQTQTEEVKSLSFEGDSVTITFRDGQSMVVGIEDFNISFTNTTTAIRKVKTDRGAEDNAYYDLRGVKTNASAKGILIHNGKKIIKTK